MTKKKENPPSLEEFVEVHDTARFAENQELLRNLRAARAVARQHEQELAEVKDRLAVYETLAEGQIEPPVWKAPTGKRAASAAVPCLGLGDIHWGEIVNPDRIGGLNAYSVAIAGQRVKRVFERTVVVARDYIQGLDFDGIQVFLTGDNISGLIHEELRETNEEAVTESVLGVTEALSAGIRLLAEEFGRVSVLAVVGNHSRLSKLNPTKNPQECLDWLVYQMVGRDFKGDERVAVTAPRALGAHCKIYNTRYYLTHGTQFKGGSGISGAAAPLLLGAHRATRRAAAAGTPFDIMVCGHFHQAIFWPSKGLIVAGAPKGYDEYASSKEMEPEPAQATFWVTTPQHGLTFYAPIWAADRDEESW